MPTTYRAPSHRYDVVILGGGIAGLWLLCRLLREGYHAVLLEADRLGGGQTIASQGIIHGGLKYALGGALTRAAAATAAMPDRWRACLAGAGDIDLRGVATLSRQFHLWSPGSLRSRLRGFLASKAVRGRVATVPRADWPAPFGGGHGGGTLYQLPDFVVDVESLLRCLLTLCEGHVFRIDDAATAARLDPGGGLRQQLKSGPSALDTTRREPVGGLRQLAIARGSARATLAAQCFVLAAGAGNDGLLTRLGRSAPPTQRRPLKMAYLRQPALPAVYAHCLGEALSATPELTITAHPDGSGEYLWYLGGSLAETGVGRSDRQQIAAARDALGRFFPGLDVAADETAWSLLDIDRAEVAASRQRRPDDAALLDEGKLLSAWPTKLTLAPVLADRILARLRERGVERAGGGTSLAEAGFAPPAIARPVWCRP